MNPNHLNDQRYRLKDSIQCSDERGNAQRTFKVLAGTSTATGLHSSTAKQTQVAVQDGSGNTFYFTADQACQLASALQTAADTRADDLKADC